MNSSNDKFDYLIGLAMLDYAAKEAEAYDAIDDSDISVDEEFDKRIYRLIGKKEREPKIKKIKKISFRVAVAAMLIMSIMFISIMAISGLREALWNVIVKWYDDYIAVIFVPNETEATDQQNKPSESVEDTGKESVGVVETNDNTGVIDEETSNSETYPKKILEYRKPIVSNEYMEMELLKESALYMIDYYINDEWVFSFQQNVKAQDEEQFDNAGMEIKNISIKGGQAILLLSSNGEPNMITWNDEQYLYTINGFLNESELIEIAETVE